MIVPPAAVGPSGVEPRPGVVAEKLSPDKAKLIKMIEFPELSASAGKPVLLVLDEKEAFTHKTFRDLIARGNLIVAVKYEVLGGAEYYFYDAQEFDKQPATCRKSSEP